MLADGLGLELDDVAQTFERGRRKREDRRPHVEPAPWALRSRCRLVKGVPRLVVEHVTRIDDDLARSGRPQR